MICFEIVTMSKHRLPFPVSYLIESFKLLTENHPLWLLMVTFGNPGSICKNWIAAIYFNSDNTTPSYPKQADRTGQKVRENDR